MTEPFISPAPRCARRRWGIAARHGLGQRRHRQERWRRLALGVSVLAFALCAPPALAASMPQETAAETPAETLPPNVLLILTDDQRFDELGFLDATLQTPHLDALAREGVYFRNAFVTTSLCSPSRASILTGQAMRNHGVIDNNRPLPEGLELFPARLRAQGYETGFVGKWHMGGAASRPRPEFDRWVSFPGQGNYEPVDLLGRPSMLDVDGQPVPQRGYITDELTDYAIDFLEKRDTSRPFFLYLSHKAVHSPFAAAARHADQYSGSEVPLGAAKSPPVGVPLWVQNQRNSWHGEEFAYHSDLPLQEFRREYRRALSAVDDSVGRLRAWLARNGLAENTVVIYLSDNGFLFGEHGLIDKRNAYEESMRIPLLAVAPGRFPEGLVVEEMVANLDIAPTVLELAGAALPSHYDGASFLTLAEGEAVEDWRSHLAYEYYWEFNYPQTPSTFALRTPRYKYVQYHGVWDTEELFDLGSDPQEQNNLIDHPDLVAVKVDLRQRLYAALASRSGERAIPFSRKFNQGAVFRHRERSPAAEFPGTWLRTGTDGDVLEHLVPDGAGKEAVVERLHRVLRAPPEEPR